MVWKTLTATAAVLALASASTARADKAVLDLQPSSKWVLSYDKESCQMRRTFGADEQQVELVLAQYAPGTRLEVLLAGKVLKSDGRVFHFLQFEPAPRFVVQPLLGEMPDGKSIWQIQTSLIPEKAANALRRQGAHQSVWLAAQAQAAERAKAITFSGGVNQAVRLHAGNLASVFTAMDVCLDDLVRTWGYDPVEQKALVEGPIPTNRFALPRKFDFPDAALRKGYSGDVNFRLAIDSAGAIEDCVIQAAYSDPSFAAEVCKTFRQEVRFKPARNAAGEAVRSYYWNSIGFRAD